IEEREVVEEDVAVALLHDVEETAYGGRNLAHAAVFEGGVRLLGEARQLFGREGAVAREYLAFGPQLELLSYGRGKAAVAYMLVYRQRAAGAQPLFHIQQGGFQVGDVVQRVEGGDVV